MKSNIKAYVNRDSANLARAEDVWVSLQVKGLKVESFYGGKTFFMVTYNGRNLIRSGAQHAAIAQAERAARFALKGGDLNLV